MTINFAASLTELLNKEGLGQVVGAYRDLAEAEKIELCSTAAFHPILPWLPPEEIERQIKLNHQINRRAFGRAWRPQGFFPPEMAYSKRVGQTAARAGFSWISLSETALPAHPRQPHLFRLKDAGIYVFFRDASLSIGLAFSQITTPTQFKRALRTYDKDRYVLISLDGETFGHHRPEQLSLLEKLLADRSFEWLTVSALSELDLPVAQVSPTTSTWGEVDEHVGQVIWPRWNNPANPVHVLQWKLTNLALTAAGDDRGQGRALLDRALASDQNWWASFHPCWHPDMVERGAALLLEAVLRSKSASPEEKEEAQNLYEDINETGRKVFGAEKINC